MQRDITQKLVEWKLADNRKPMIVRGARQVGKSFSIKDFGANYFEGNMHIVNLESRPDWHSVFDKNFDVIRILAELEIFLGKRIRIGQDLLFFDEIQECPKAILSLRYFYEQLPELHVIAAGSLLEFALKEISFPVGRVQLLNMHPMSFHEFLRATGKELLAEVVAQKPGKLAENIHQLLNDELKKYFFIGGMPECVKTYTETNSMAEVFSIQSDLINTFRQDFSKYALYSDKRCINTVLSSVAQQVGSQIKYSRLAEGFTTPTIKKAFELLETARLFKKVTAANPGGMPLNAGANDKLFKAVMLDIGLFSSLCGLNVAKEFQQTDLLAIFRGALAEQFVGQELIAAENNDLFYWSRQEKSSNAETDFLIETTSGIVPVEVKSGPAGSLKSLHILFNTYPNVRKAFVFSSALYGEIPEQKITFIPLYHVASAVKFDPRE
jgi:predicted AAA+ superfamily ATPase